MFFLAEIGDRMEAEGTVELVHHIGCLGTHWNHVAGEVVPAKLVDRVDTESWSRLLRELRPQGRELLYLAWAETVSILVAMALLVIFLFRRESVIAASAFCSLFAATLVANVVVIRLVRRRAEQFSGRHGPALAQRGVAISAHLERWELVCTRAELWFELQVQARGSARVHPRQMGAVRV